MVRNPMNHELKAEFLGHQIAVKFSANFLTTTSAESKLYIDGEVQETLVDGQWLAGDQF